MQTAIDHELHYSTISSTSFIERHFESLFLTHYLALCNYAFKFLLDKDSSEDIVQQVFTNLWEKKDSIRVTKSAKSYLYRAVRNRCLNALTSSKSQSELPSNLADQSAQPDEKVFYLDLLHQVSHCINSLPPKCKIIFKQSKLEELKNGEIANLHNISIKTVETHMSKALKVMRHALK